MFVKKVFTEILIYIWRKRATIYSTCACGSLSSPVF